MDTILCAKVWQWESNVDLSSTNGLDWMKQCLEGTRWEAEQEGRVHEEPWVLHTRDMSLFFQL